MPPPAVQGAAIVAVAGAAIHALLFVALHLLEPGVSPISSLISDYAGTRHAWMATAAFVAFGVAWGALAVALSSAPSHPALTVGRVLFALALVAILVGAVFPASVDPRTGSVASRLQNLIARPGLFLGVLLVSWALHRAPGWETTGPWLLGLALAAVALLPVTLAVLDAGFGGIGQRALFAILYLWIVLVARGLGT